MNPFDLLIPVAHAQTAGQDPSGGLMSSSLFFIVLIAIMYFIMIRPQMKRQKEHRQMLEKLQKGDEVITSGGIAGTVSAISESFITVEVADGVQLRVQKGAISNVLPKGTLKSA
ncbi:preprotein translocase subunit YajC [Thermomonas sp.]|uniref:preprotein translocase subunit YajC n=1 Tax=Thermomonas sp. TaxID=1971895 RepID=UPI0026220089|nr:preprotein translocase subunit YajC [Thermomonas sp.]